MSGTEKREFLHNFLESVPDTLSVPTPYLPPHRGFGSRLVVWRFRTSTSVLEIEPC